MQRHGGEVLGSIFAPPSGSTAFGGGINVGFQAGIVQDQVDFLGYPMNNNIGAIGQQGTVMLNNISNLTFERGF